MQEWLQFFFSLQMFWKLFLLNSFHKETGDITQPLFLTYTLISEVSGLQIWKKPGRVTCRPCQSDSSQCRAKRANGSWGTPPAVWAALHCWLCLWPTASQGHKTVTPAPWTPAWSVSPDPGPGSGFRLHQDSWNSSASGWGSPGMLLCTGTSSSCLCHFIFSFSLSFLLFVCPTNI